MAADERPDDDALDQAERQEYIEHRSIALQLVVLNVMETSLNHDAARRLIATHALAELLARLMCTTVQENPAALRSSLFILDAVRERVAEAGLRPGARTH